MRQLTFKAFLSNYLRSLSAQETSAPFRLAKELTEQPRLMAPLCLYAVQTLSETQLHRLRQQHPDIDNEFSNNAFLSRSTDSLSSSLESMDNMNAYRKCWNSYISVRDKKIHEQHTKQLMAKKINTLQHQYGISNYQVYKTLNLNPGNVNAFLAHADGSKVSMDTARRILIYVRSFENTL